MQLELELNKAIKSKNEKIIRSIFEKIYLEYGKTVCFKIMYYVKDSNVAEDLMQDVFISFYNNIVDITIRNIKSYLLKSAKNKALDYLKSKNTALVIDEKYVYDNEGLYEKDNTIYKDVISRMKKILSDYEIEIVLKHTLDDMSFRELSKKYKKPISTILTTYYRAIKKMKEDMNNEKYNS